MRISVIGSSGQLGTDLVKSLSTKNEIQALTHADVEVTSIESLLVAFRGFKPHVVLNTAAFHRLDMCEANPDRAFEVNERGASNVALAAHETGARTVFISTDYVFEGDKQFTESYSENDEAVPVNVYGRSKRAGEQATLAVNTENLVGRISSVFGTAGSSGKGGNFVEAIVAKIQNGGAPEVVGDNRMSPTYTVSVANMIEPLITLAPGGIYHLNNSGSISWFEFAAEIARNLGSKISVLETTSDPNSSIRRPINSSLDNSKISELSPVMPWYDALRNYMFEKGHL